MAAKFRTLLLFSLFLILLGCGPATEFTVLIKMMPNQEKYFENSIIPAFEKENNCKIKIIHFEDMWQIDSLLKAYPNTGLVKTPFEMTRVLEGRGSIKALNDFLQPADIEDMKNTYFLMDLGTMDEKIYFVPRKFESRMLVYLKTKVQDAVNRWVLYEDTIRVILKEYNGYGLPHKYRLENNPDQWDFYDIFVAGYYWAHTDYKGRKGPRVAHRGKRYPGTALRLVDRVYQMGGTSEDVLKMNTEPVIDALEWEALYIKEGIFQPRMWMESWSGSGIWEGFQSGDVFLSFLTQIDCFFLHGAETKDMPGYLSDPDDMGVSVMPQGVSVALDSYGNYLRKGKRSVTTGGWWWGIPQNSPSPVLSYKLARHITTNDNQVEGCSNFGMVPVRKDILGDISLMFGGGWVTSVFDVAFAQLVHNRYTTIPLTDHYDEVGKNYIELWYDICVGQSCVVDNIFSREEIANIVNAKYIPVQKQILGSEYP